jgi:hypothetical protein
MLLESPGKVSRHKERRWAEPPVSGSTPRIVVALLHRRDAHLAPGSVMNSIVPLHRVAGCGDS